MEIIYSEVTYTSPTRSHRKAIRNSHYRSLERAPHGSPSRDQSVSVWVSLLDGTACR
jgi:hypothetical protein